jgi:hypothetical protein
LDGEKEFDIFDPQNAKEAAARIEKAIAGKLQIEKYLPLLKDESILVDATDEKLLFTNERVRAALAAENADRRRFLGWAARQDFNAIVEAGTGYAIEISSAMVHAVMGKPVPDEVREKWFRLEKAYLDIGRGFEEEIARRETKLPELQRVIDEESGSWMNKGMPVDHKVTVRPPLRFKQQP